MKKLFLNVCASVAVSVRAPDPLSEGCVVNSFEMLQDL